MPLWKSSISIERQMVIKALLLEDILQEAFLQRSPHKLTDYLYQLATLVHSFYNQTPIIGQPKEITYLKILSVVKIAIKSGLAIIGIEAKDKM